VGVPVESGVQYYYDGGWLGMFAPARTPTDVVETLARAVRLAGVKPE
jgi:tripartite-type tricarboxylate transporter receptor subunit TctC